MVERPQSEEKCSMSQLICLVYHFFSGVSSTNRSVGFWHQWLCCQTVEHDTRSYLIVNNKNKSIHYSSSDYIISKSSTINHHPLLEKYNAYTQTEACNQSFTVSGTSGFLRVNRGEPNDTVVSKLRLFLENLAGVFILGLSGRDRGQS